MTPRTCLVEVLDACRTAACLGRFPIRRRLRGQAHAITAAGVSLATIPDGPASRSEAANGGGADPGGRVLRGLRWARNQGVHQLIALHENAKGISFPMTFPVRFDFNPVWRDRSVSPKAWRGVDDERTYDAEVSGKPVVYTRAAAQTFLFERAIPNPFVESLPWDMSWPLSAEDRQKSDLPDLPERPSDQQ
jgi:hypothetical protein